MSYLGVRKEVAKCCLRFKVFKVKNKLPFLYSKVKNNISPRYNVLRDSKATSKVWRIYFPVKMQQGKYEWRILVVQMNQVAGSNSIRIFQFRRAILMLFLETKRHQETYGRHFWRSQTVKLKSIHVFRSWKGRS